MGIIVSSVTTNVGEPGRVAFIRRLADCALIVKQVMALTISISARERISRLILMAVSVEYLLLWDVTA